MARKGAKSKGYHPPKGRCIRKNYPNKEGGYAAGPLIAILDKIYPKRSLAK